jgi:hypothetical protein
MKQLARKPAVRVYLDSQDVSRFSNPRELDSSPQLRNTLKSLRQLASSGAAEFRFSAAHVLEAAPTTIGAVQWAHQRANFMQGLFGSRALYFPDKLWRNEMKAILVDSVDVCSSVARREYSSNDSGDWFPDIDELGDALMTLVQKEISDQLDGFPMSEVSRSSLNSQVFNGNELSLALRAKLAEQVDKSPLSISLPVTPRFNVTYKKWLLGTATGIEVIEELRRCYSDIAKFMVRAASPGNDPTKFGTMFRKPGADLQDNIAKFREAIDSALQQAPQGIVPKDVEVSGVNIGGLEPKAAIKKICEHQAALAIENARVKARKDIYSEHAKWLSEQGVTEQMFDDWHDINPQFPSMDVYTELLVANSLINVNQPRKVASIASDWGDMFHGLYIPYVDVMRVDRFAIQYMKDVAQKYGCVLVDDLFSLPDVISQRTSMA